MWPVGSRGAGAGAPSHCVFSLLALQKAATLRHQETSDLLSEKRSLISQLQEIDEAKAAAATAEDERRSKVRSLQVSVLARCTQASCALNL